MDLLIDIGNSRIKWAMCVAGALQGADAIEHQGDVAAVNAMLDAVATPPTGVRAANVAGDRFGMRVAGIVRERWGLPVRFAVTQQRTGPVRNGYDDFRQLGIDRWLAIIAAVDQFAGSVCIVDAGTAITIDAVASGGVHLGGYIIPGLDLMRQSLGDETGDLRRLVGDQQQVADRLPALDHKTQGFITQGLITLGHSTAEAIEGGAVAGVCCLIDRCISTLRGSETDPTLVMTGGDAQRLMSHLDVAAQHRPQLVLEGLARYDFDARVGRRAES